MTTLLRRAGATAGILLAGMLAASCSDGAPSQPVQPRATAKLEILSGNNQTGGAGLELPEPLRVRAVDENGDPVPGQIVNFRVVSGNGSVFAGANVTGADGIALDYWTLGTVGWQQQVVEARAVDNATGEKIVFGTFNATFVGVTPNYVSFECCLPNQAVVGQSLQDTFTVTVVDASLIRVPNYPVTLSMVAGNGRITTLQGVTASTVNLTTDSAGQVRFRFTPGTVAATNTIRATAGGKQDTESVTGIPSAPVRFQAQPASLSLGGVNATGKVFGWGFDRFNNITPNRAQWTALQPAIVSVVSPTATGSDTVATVRGNAPGVGRVVGRIQSGAKIFADTVEVTVP